MKSTFFAFFVLALSTFATVASADWDRRPPHGPGHGGPGWGRCTVSFQKCDFALGGFCAKWNSKAFSIDRRDARYGCYMAQRQYGDIRRCRVSCP